VIFHTDRGCQYTSGDFSRLAPRLDITLSLGRKGECWDNAVAESFFATLKGELIDRYVWPTKSSARTAIFEFIESWYNLRRRHSTLGYLSPADYEAALSMAA
jgi:putative transposase